MFPYFKGLSEEKLPVFFQFMYSWLQEANVPVIYGVYYTKLIHILKLSFIVCVLLSSDRGFFPLICRVK